MRILAGLGSFCVLVSPIFSTLSVQAQVVPDDSLGTRVEPSGSRWDIEGGQRSQDGTNLLHSFATFGLEAGQVANFVTTPEIQNVLGRVTGGDLSSIEGLIQVTGSNADLFLINPAGIVFGEQARLDVAGDFTATTAEAIGFEAGWFETVGSVSWEELTGDPIAFDFSGLASGAIANFGDLAVNRDSNLNLLGGTVINGGRLSGGNVSVTAIEGGNTLQMSAAGNVLGFEVAADRMMGVGIAPIALPELLTGGEITSAGSLEIVDGVVMLAGAEITLGDSVVTGAIDVSGATGGVVQVLGDRVLVAGAHIDASGELGGGAIYLGGEYRGGGTLPTAAFTVVDRGSWLDASAINLGDGGEVIVWADDTAGFWGEITARGGVLGGNGGFVETSGAGSLVFRGGVDLAAPEGSVGSLLLDPTNITISTTASDPIELESAATNPFRILASDYDGQDVTLNSNFLERITGDVTLEATNDITLTTNLTFASGGGAIVFTADSDRDGTGTFNGINASNGGRPQRFEITASGRDVTISGTNVTIGTLDTSTTGSNTTSGSVNLRSYGTRSRITVDTINTSSVGENSHSGSVYLESDGRLEVSVTPAGQGINTSNTEVSSSSSSGSPPSSPPPPTSGSGSPPPPTAALPSTAGDITLISRATAPNAVLRAYNLNTSSSSDNAQSGSITINSNGGNLLLGQADASSSGSNSRSGDISINSGGGELVTLSDRASGLGTGAHGKNGIGGSIHLTSEGGRINAQVLDASSRGWSARSGDVTIYSDGGVIESNYVSTATPDQGSTQSGQITIDSRSNHSTNQMGAIDIEHLNTASASQEGQAGDIQVYGSGAIDLGYILALSANQAGNVTIGSDDTISIVRLDTYGVLGASGAITIGGLPDGSTADRIQIERIESLSYNGATQGGISITADGDITLSESIQTGASTGKEGSNTQIESLNGSIAYQTIRTTVADARPINQNFTSSSGVISIVEEYAALADDTTLSRYFTNELDRLVDTLKRIESKDFAAVTTPAPAGNLALIAPNGTITASGNLDTYSQRGAAGQIAITGGSGLTLQNVTSYGNTASGDLTITSTGAIATADITTLASSGQSGNVIINGTSVASGNVSSIAGTGSGDIDITATDGTITTRNLSTTTTSGSSGNVTVGGTGNVTTGNITSSTSGTGNSGDITASSTEGSVTTGDVTTESTEGNAGNIDFSALIDVITGNLTSRAGQSSGEITLNAGRDINTGEIASEAIEGDSGDINLTAGRDITTGDITSSSANGQSGDIGLVAGGNINTGDISTRDGQISLDAGETIATGELRSDNVAIINGEPLGEITIDPSTAATQARNTAIATLQTDSSLNPNILTATAIDATRPTRPQTARNPDDPSNPDANTNVLTALSDHSLILQNTDVSLDDIIEFDDSRTAEYIEHFGGNGNLAGSVAATREAMATIEAQTGIRTGVVYISLRDTAIDLSVITAVGAPVTVSVPVDRTRLLETVATYRQHLISARYRIRGQGEAAAAQLYDWLIRPIVPDLEALGVQTLMFSLDAGLRGLPLAALQDGEHYLIEAYSFSLIPSIGLIDTRYQALEPNAPMLATGASQFATLSPLPAVPAELESLVHYRRNGQIFLNEDFTRHNIVTERRQTAYPIVHLATHAEFNAGDLSNSYIQLWDEHIGLDDIRELGWHDPAVELLVLSACHTALGNDEAEMGFAGLAVAAGVKTAIASLWSVDDTATFLLMTELYHYLSNAPIKAEALRAAQLALINGTLRIENNQIYAGGNAEPIPLPESFANLAARDFSHPYYWSAFTAIGAPW